MVVHSILVLFLEKMSTYSCILMYDSVEIFVHAIQCNRGARSSIGAYTRAPPPLDLVQVESRLSE